MAILEQNDRQHLSAPRAYFEFVWTVPSPWGKGAAFEVLALAHVRKDLPEEEEATFELLKRPGQFRMCSKGFTLLEVLLATAVLLIGLAVVFQTTRSALQRMATAKELAQAQMACQAILNELLAQSASIQPDTGRAIADLPHWKIRIDLYPAPQPRLYVLHLSAQQFSPQDGMFLGIRYQLIRWIPIERVWFPEEQAEMMGGNEFEALFP